MWFGGMEAAMSITSINLILLLITIWLWGLIIIGWFITPAVVIPLGPAWCATADCLAG